ncbi:MAG: 30S ribosomal protein S2 [Candidatus Shikimatogenerans bostrichidophilus]|nr:MAG: 30S ribosomal protein S2 [Candidatus Shikimatogenerans bostrichidophilus]
MVNKKIIKKNLKKIYKNKVFWGHEKKYRNPKNKNFILFNKNKYDIIDPIKTIKYIYKAKSILKKSALSGGIILFIGTKKQIKNIIKKYAKLVKMPYINYKWPAGLLTNIKNTRLSIKKKKIIKKQQKTIYKYLSKKEKLLINRKYKKIKKKFGSISNMNRLPLVAIIVDVNKEIIAVKEAYKKSIYTIGIIDTDSNPDYIDLPIPANDDLSKSVNYILNKLTKSIFLGIKEREKNIKKKKDEKERN